MKIFSQCRCTSMESGVAVTAVISEMNSHFIISFDTLLMAEVTTCLAVKVGS
jgi:hypothetical protein